MDKKNRNDWHIIWYFILLSCAILSIIIAVDLHQIRMESIWFDTPHIFRPTITGIVEYKGTDHIKDFNLSIKWHNFDRDGMYVIVCSGIHRVYNDLHTEVIEVPHRYILAIHNNNVEVFNKIQVNRTYEFTCRQFHSTDIDYQIVSIKWIDKPEKPMNWIPYIIAIIIIVVFGIAITYTIYRHKHYSFLEKFNNLFLIILS